MPSSSFDELSTWLPELQLTVLSVIEKVAKDYHTEHPAIVTSPSIQYNVTVSGQLVQLEYSWLVLHDGEPYRTLIFNIKKEAESYEVNVLGRFAGTAGRQIPKTRKARITIPKRPDQPDRFTEAVAVVYEQLMVS